MTTPRCIIKPDSLTVFKNVWSHDKTQFDEMTDEQWERGFEEAGLTLPESEASGEEISGMDIYFSNSGDLDPRRRRPAGGVVDRLAKGN